MTSFGMQLRKLRLHQGLNQRELGAKAGIDPSRISKYESGNLQEPRGATLKRLARALNVSVTELRGEFRTQHILELESLLRTVQTRWTQASTAQREAIEAQLTEIARVQKSR